MAIITTATINLSDGEVILVSSDKSPIPYALVDIKDKLIYELDHAFAQWECITIVLNRS